MTTPSSPRDVTRLLDALSDGRTDVMPALLPLVYDELRRLASSYLRRERVDHTLQPTALVHEAYLKLVDQRVDRWQNRSHFLGIAAQAMRRILVDHARAYAATKRGAGMERVTLGEGDALGQPPDVDVIALDAALTRLAAVNARQARVVELRSFAGLDVDETARVLDVSPVTIKRDWAMARDWLQRELAPLGPPNADPNEGRRVGAYVLQRCLGHGGMGSVYLAVRADASEANAPVAIKLMHPRRGANTIRRRFDLERQTLAALDHPHIARLIDAGSLDDTVPYFVMEYVPGLRLDRHCDARGLDVRARIELFLRVCDAVSYAHGHAIVHRDLKPDNIVVSDAGVPKLLDFGIVKVLDRARAVPLTDPLAARPLTLAYASPEQILGAPITPAVDVYALGVVLFELLTGTRPYAIDADDLGAAMQTICEAPPAPLGPGFDADLDAIVRAALHKDPARRTASVDAFAGHLRRWLDRQAPP